MAYYYCYCEIHLQNVEFCIIVKIENFELRNHVLTLSFFKKYKWKACFFTSPNLIISCLGNFANVTKKMIV